jgi:flagellar biosynthesis protein FlhF
MKLKSYFARNVKTALDLARVELGPDAMLVESRKAPPEARRQGEWEVVMALPHPEESQSAPALGPAPAASVAAQELARLTSEMAEMRRQIERMASSVNRSAALQSARSFPQPELAELFAELTGAGIDPEPAHHILNRQRLAGMPAEGLRRAVEKELAARLRCDDQLGLPGRDPRIAAVVGPCGSGKTTLLVKLAVRYGLTARRPTQILSIDTVRVAAADQLRAYSGILGVGFQAVETPFALAQAIEEHRNKSLILIDTPGYCQSDWEDTADLARFLTSREDVDVHLVLTASMKSADLSRVVDRFEIFRPRKLAFTKLDETETFGSIWNQAARTGKPVSFLASGQQIPEDLVPAATDRILNLVLPRGATRAAVAAAA